MNQQYLVQSNPQIIDLFENMPTQSSLNVVITAFKPFEYTFLSSNQVNTVSLTTLPLLTATNVGKTINMSQRYLMVKAEQPIAITVRVAVSQNVPELFPTNVILPLASVIGVIVLAGLVVGGVIIFIQIREKRKGSKTTKTTAASRPRREL